MADPVLQKEKKYFPVIDMNLTFQFRKAKVSAARTLRTQFVGKVVC